jgi:outer membrane protein insertion porin family
MQATHRVRLPTRCAAVLVSLLLGGLAARAQGVAPAGRQVVNDVIIKGNRIVPTEQIRARLRTRPGSDFSQAALEEDVRTLFTSKQFANVRADLAQRPDVGPNRVDVIFTVNDLPGTIQKITYQGAKHLSEEDLANLTQLHVGSSMNPTQNRYACRQIVEKYIEEGRPFASCQLLKGGEKGDNEILFNITEGPKVVVRDIRFTGNTFVSAAVLNTHVQSSREILGAFGGKLNPAMVESDIHALLTYYRSFGFHDVQVKREIQWDPDGRTVVLVFHIDEGVRYKVQDVPQVLGARTVPHEQLEAISSIKPASYYSEPAVNLDVERLKAYFGYLGEKVDVVPNIVWNPQGVPGLCTVQYELNERPPDRVGQIKIVGNERTRQNVILRQLPLYPGQLLTYPDIQLGENNLRRLNIFKSNEVSPKIEVQDDPLNPESPYKDILVKVEEDNTGSLMFGIGVNSDIGPTGSIVLNERNFDILRPPTSIEDFFNGNAWRGGGQEFRIEAVPGIYMNRYTISWREPFLFDSPYSLLVSGYYYTMMYNEYTEGREGTRITLGRRLNQLWQASLSTRIENINVSNVSSLAPEDYLSVLGNNFLVGFRGTVTRDARDNFMRPTSGNLLNLSVEQCTGEHNFTLANIDGSQYFTVWQRADGSGKQVVALHSQVGWASDTTPVYERFFAGGFRTLRGFQYRGVGPNINGFMVGGDFLWLNSIEYQIPLLARDNVYFVTFLDSGTVMPRINDTMDYRVSAGFGFRLQVPMLGPVPIALDFGFPIVKAPSDITQIFNFWMGFFR